MKDKIYGGLTLLLMWLTHFLPLPVIHQLAQFIAGILIHTRNARTTLINIQRCFPELTPTQQKQWAKQHLAQLIQSILEIGLLWWPNPKRLNRLIELQGQHHMSALDSEPVIILTPHFVGLEMQGAYLGKRYKGVGFYTPHKNPIINQKILNARHQLGDIIMLDKKKGLRPLIRAIKNMRRLFFLPDMDFGEQTAIFVPFFNIPAATVTTLPGLCTLTGATVIPCICYQKPKGQGYVIEFQEPWKHYPTGNIEQDITRMNQFIEEQVIRFPTQYYWSHKRFRTRPSPDEPYFYRWPQSNNDQGNQNVTDSNK